MTAPVFADPRWRYALLFAVYAYQGVVAGFAVTALPNHWAESGAGTAEIGGHIALVGLPWIVQPLWGPLVDRFGGSCMGARRPWMLAAMLLSLGAIAALPWAADGARHDVSLVLLVHSAAAALLDTATDALTIDRVPPGHFGAANACTRAGLVSGVAAGAALTGAALPAWGVAGVAVPLLAFGAVALLLPLLVREAPGDALLSWRTRRPMAAGARPGFRRLARRLVVGFRRPHALALLAVCVVEEFAGAAFGTRLAVALVQEGGWNAASLSRLQGALAFAAGTLGALVVGRCADRFGAPPVLALLLGATGAGLASTSLLLGVVGVAAVGPLALGLAVVMPVLVFAALAPAVMRASRGAAAATRFAVFMAALNLGGVTGAAAAGPLGDALPLWGLGLAAVAVFVGCAVAAAWPGVLARPPPAIAVLS